MDCLTGVMHLFETCELSVHANSGRVSTAANKKIMARVLKNFGPCMIRVDDIPCDCWRCVSEYSLDWPSNKHSRFGTSYKSLIDLRDNDLLEWLRAFNI